MAGIYNADIFCDDCAGRIKEDICADIADGNIHPSSDLLIQVDFDDNPDAEDIRNQMDLMGESDYDSDDYPKYASDTEESDCPQHCGGCGEFMENGLTDYGNDYVIEAVNEDRLDGRADSVACTEWAPFYSHLDYVEQCADCGDYHEDLEDDLCPDCMEKYNA